MRYKTIALELIQEQPEIYEQLRQERTLLKTLNRYAADLKASHHAWTEQLRQAKPGSDPSQTASEALEMALHDLQARLSSASPPSDAVEPPSLDAAMNFLRRHTPPA